MPNRRARRAAGARLSARGRVRYVLPRMAVMLRDARLASSLRQADVAERAGVSQPFWSRLERGVATAVTVETLAACGAAVGLQLAAFFERAPGTTLPRDYPRADRPMEHGAEPEFPCPLHPR